MDQATFWKLIADAGVGRDPFEQADALTETLSTMPAADIVAFDRHVRDLLTRSYSWKLWGAAYLINGGCSDDGFDYFRGWLIGRGQDTFEQALADPDSLANHPELDEEVECEEFLYVAQSAHETVAGGDLPGEPYDMPDLGEGWDFDDEGEMQARYPKLFARFG